MFYNNYKWSLTFKNYESLYYIPVAYVTLYINYTSIKKFHTPSKYQTNSKYWHLFIPMKNTDIKMSMLKQI